VHRQAALQYLSNTYLNSCDISCTKWIAIHKWRTLPLPPSTHTHTQTTWKQTTAAKKIKMNTVQRRMEGLPRQQQYSLDERRVKVDVGMLLYTKNDGGICS